MLIDSKHYDCVQWLWLGDQRDMHAFVSPKIIPRNQTVYTQTYHKYIQNKFNNPQIVSEQQYAHECVT